jgi:hypothetical protein
MCKNLFLLALVILALAASVAMITPHVQTDEIVIWRGLLVIDRYDGMISSPAFGWYYCPPAANCARY